MVCSEPAGHPPDHQCKAAFRNEHAMGTVDILFYSTRNLGCRDYKFPAPSWWMKILLTINLHERRITLYLFAINGPMSPPIYSRVNDGRTNGLVWYSRLNRTINTSTHLALVVSWNTQVTCNTTSGRYSAEKNVSADGRIKLYSWGTTQHIIIIWADGY